jgi:hypothetical protein
VPRELRPNIRQDRSKEPSSSEVLGGQAMLMRNTNTNPNNGATSNKIDPFNTLPVGERGNFQYLARNCKLKAVLFLFLITIWPAVHIIFYPTERPYSPLRPTFEKEECLNAVIFDSALLHITLAHVSMSLCALSSTKLSPDAIFHVGQAIAIVNQRIAKRYKVISDDPIFAITILTSLEVCALLSLRSSIAYRAPFLA